MANKHGFWHYREQKVGKNVIYGSCRADKHPAEWTVNLPEEVWRLIASYLPERRIFELLSVNRTFFNVGLDTRYREVIWTKLDEKFLDVLLYIAYSKCFPSTFILFLALTGF